MSGNDLFQNIIVCSNDTDVLNILFLTCQLISDAGLHTNNTRRNIDVSKINCVRSLCSALPSFHSFTGCDFTSSFMYNGKVRPVTVLEKNPMFIEAFSLIGEHLTVTEILKTYRHLFVPYMVDPILKSVNAARVIMFQQSLLLKGAVNLWQKLKALTSSHLPACYNVLLQKISQANYVALYYIL